MNNSTVAEQSAPREEKPSLPPRSHEVAGRRPGRSPIEQEKARGLLLMMEHKMRDHKMAILGDSDSMPVKSLFSNGMYVREISIPRGTLVMGKIHKHEHPNILVKGSVVMMTEDGVETIKAPLTMVSKAGTKRFLFTLEDTIWITMHRTDKTTAFEAEDDIVTTRYEDMNMDYEAMLTSIGGQS